MRSFTHFKPMLPLGLIVSVPVLYCITQTKTELSSFYDLNTSLIVKFAKLNPQSFIWNSFQTNFTQSGIQVELGLRYPKIIKARKTNIGMSF